MIEVLRLDGLVHCGTFRGMRFRCPRFWMMKPLVREPFERLRVFDVDIIELRVR
jgi:hypothetical protein